MTAAAVSALALPAGLNSPAAALLRPSRAVTREIPAGTEAAAVRYWTPARMSATLQAAAPKPAAPATESRSAQPRSGQPRSGQPRSGQPRSARPRSGQPQVTQYRQLVRVRSRSRAAAHPAAPAQPWLSGDTTGHGLRWTHGGTVTAAVGKVFFSLGGADYVCSGTLVGGTHPVVATAAHCVSGGPGARRDKRWATNWLFVPGYREGALPYGEFTALRFLVEPAWTGPQGGSEQYDVSFVQVTGIKPDGKPSAVRPPPGLPAAFAGSQETVVTRSGYIFGYPAEPPYTGLFQDYCAGAVTAGSGSARTSCQMTAGDSGGPWLTGFSPRTGRGTIFAVSTYKLSDDMRTLYGAVLGPAARAIYQQALSTAG